MQCAWKREDARCLRPVHGDGQSLCPLHADVGGEAFLRALRADVARQAPMGRFDGRGFIVHDTARFFHELRDFPEIDLTGAQLQGPGRVERLRLRRLTLHDANVNELLLVQSEVDAVLGENVTIHSHLALAGCRLGEVALIGAREGRITLAHSVARSILLPNADVKVVNARGLRTGEFLAYHARIGELSLDDAYFFRLAELRNANVDTLILSGCYARKVDLTSSKVGTCAAHGSTFPEFHAQRATFRSLELVDVRGTNLTLTRSAITDRLHVQDVSLARVETPGPPRGGDLTWGRDFVYTVPPAALADIEPPLSMEPDLDDLEGRLIAYHEPGADDPFLNCTHLTFGAGAAGSFVGYRAPFPMDRVFLLHTDVRRVDFVGVAWPSRGGRVKVPEEEVVLRSLEPGHDRGRRRAMEALTMEQALEDNESAPVDVHVDIRLPGGLDLHDLDPRHVEELYRRLRAKYEEGLRFHEAGDFFVGEMEMRRIAPGFRSGPVAWLRRNASILGAYAALSLYGQSYRRALGWVVSGLLGFAILRVALDPPATAAGSLAAVGPAVAASALAFFHIEDGTLIDRIEGAVSLFLLAVFALALRQRLMRHSALGE